MAATLILPGLNGSAEGRWQGHWARGGASATIASTARGRAVAGRLLCDNGIRSIGADYQADKKALASGAFSRFHIRLNK
ncbi:hypothetical protein RHSP_45287 [Rhizobium freirei PRF 81]|uniref:Uncharacterized protein n=1 Tax=Rhizobium freirei PRF 81 TaxID=363754 RepID=N6V3H0_9HYPH|nr:hypothetical protein RHSP_45287 [Rhizobium freirei PRF 81]